MFGNFKKLFVKIQSEFSAHSHYYFLLTIVLILAFLLRVYRLNDLMGFYYDQGRDALVIWKLWHEGKPFLVGPITGLHGIFLGPFYYYLIAPFYLIGGGNPVVPAIFLAFLSTLAIGVVYILGVKLHSKTCGLIAVAISSFSYYMVHAGRWLSNPTPILLTSVLLLWCMWEIIDQSRSELKNKKNNVLWFLVTMLIAVSLQFESASAVFYLPILFVFSIWQRQKLPKSKTILICIVLFLLTLIPQIIFNFRHDNLIVNSFHRVLVSENSFRLDVAEVLLTRLDYFWQVFYSKIIPEASVFVAIMTFLSLFSIFSSAKAPMKEKVIPLFLIFLLIPIIFYTLFQGNFGNIFDYYMSGYYLPMILLFSIGLSEFMVNKFTKIVVLIFFMIFLHRNTTMLKSYLTSDVNGENTITLVNQIKAVDYILDDGKNYGEFNVDFYVPPVIPYAYDYLFLWHGGKKCGRDICGLVKNREVSVFYTPHETDNFHPERLTEWLTKQDSAGNVVDQESFAGITVQRRVRNK